jgi:hypothetical protein
LARKLLARTVMPSAGIDQRLNRGKWGYLTGLVYPHGLAWNSSPNMWLRIAVPSSPRRAPLTTGDSALDTGRLPLSSFLANA